jgi:hypothetical protein
LEAFNEVFMGEIDNLAELASRLATSNNVRHRIAAPRRFPQRLFAVISFLTPDTAFSAKV